jgi:hypothetical protein
MLARLLPKSNILVYKTAHKKTIRLITRTYWFQFVFHGYRCLDQQIQRQSTFYSNQEWPGVYRMWDEEEVLIAGQLMIWVFRKRASLKTLCIGIQIRNIKQKYPKLTKIRYDLCDGEEVQIAGHQILRGFQKCGSLRGSYISIQIRNIKLKY